MFGFRKFEGKCKGKKIKKKSWKNEKVKKNNKKNRLKVDKLFFCYFTLILFILTHEYIN